MFSAFLFLGVKLEYLLATLLKLILTLMEVKVVLLPLRRGQILFLSDGKRSG